MSAPRFGVERTATSALELCDHRAPRCRTRTSRNVSDDGPPRLVVLVGQEGGRWAHELGHPSDVARKLVQQFTHYAQATFGEVPPAGCVVGLAVLCSWRPVTAVASDE